MGAGREGVDGRARRLPLVTVRFGAVFGRRPRAATDPEEGPPYAEVRDVLRVTRRAARVMRIADGDGRRASAEHDLDGYEKAWRSYHDAAQQFREAAGRWEELVGSRQAYLDDLPDAPAWTAPVLAEPAVVVSLVEPATPVDGPSSTIRVDGPSSAVSGAPRSSRTGPAVARPGRSGA